MAYYGGICKGHTKCYVQICNTLVCVWPEAFEHSDPAFVTVIFTSMEVVSSYILQIKVRKIVKNYLVYDSIYELTEICYFKHTSYLNSSSHF